MTTRNTHPKEAARQTEDHVAARPDFAPSFARVLPAAMALEASALVTMANVEVAYAAGTVMGKHEVLETLRSLMAQMPLFDMRCFDGLDDVARALAFSDGRLKALSKNRSLVDDRAEAIKLRTVLKSDAQSLATRDLFEPGLFENLANTTSERGLASDLLTLVAAFHENAARIKGKTAATEAELARAVVLADTLLKSVSEGDDPRSPETLALADERQRIFSLFHRDYTQVRRAVAYLRFDAGDADDYAPSLYEAHASKHSASEPSASSATSNVTSTTGAASAAATEHTASGAAATEQVASASNPFAR